MCGRFTLTILPDNLAEYFELSDYPQYELRYNIAPTQRVPVVIIDNSGKRVMKMFRWGLIPFWAKDMKISSRLINSRGETVSKRPSFREAFKKRRCLIPASGFYEWKKDVTGKQPYYIKLKDDSPLGFAGLWEQWYSSKGELIESCTIITTVSNELIGQLHDRMPVILNRDDYETWLDTATTEPENLLPLLKPYPSEQMVLFPVSKGINSPSYDDPSFVKSIQ